MLDKCFIVPSYIECPFYTDNKASLYCIVLYCIVLYCIVLYCIVLYCIVFITCEIFDFRKYGIRFVCLFLLAKSSIFSLTGPIALRYLAWRNYILPSMLITVTATVVGLFVKISPKKTFQISQVSLGRALSSVCVFVSAFVCLRSTG